jgi:hypothetical protein
MESGDSICHSRKGFHSPVVVVEYLEQLEDAHQSQGLHCKLGRLHQLQAAATLLGCGQKTDEQADSTGIDHSYLGKIEDNAGVSVTEGLFHGLSEVIDRGAHAQLAAELNHLYLRTLTDVDIQLCASLQRHAKVALTFQSLLLRAKLREQAGICKRQRFNS